MNQYVINDLIAEKITGEWGKEPTSNATKVIRTTNFTNDGKLNLLNVVERNIDSKIIQKKKLQVGDVIIEKSGGSPTQPVGRVVYFDVNENENYLCNNFTSILRPSSKVNPKYLFFALYYFHLTKRTLAYQNKTTGIINLQLDRYINTEKIPLPPLDEQQQIVDMLTQADSLRQKRKLATVLLDEYIKSVFIEMFGDIEKNPFNWPSTTLEKITRKVTDGTHQPPKFVDKGIPFIFISNIIDNEINLETKKHITEGTYNELTRRTPIEKYDILYTTVGSYGHPAIVKSERKFCFQRHIAHIKPDHSKTNVYFLYGMLKSPSIKRQADNKARGVAQKTLNLADLKNFNVILPPIEQQNKFGKIVMETEAIKQKMLSQSNELENQFQALMQKYFTFN